MDNGTNLRRYRFSRIYIIAERFEPSAVNVRARARAPRRFPPPNPAPITLSTSICDAWCVKYYSLLLPPLSLDQNAIITLARRVCASAARGNRRIGQWSISPRVSFSHTHARIFDRAKIRRVVKSARAVTCGFSRCFNAVRRAPLRFSTRSEAIARVDRKIDVLCGSTTPSLMRFFGKI